MRRGTEWWRWTGKDSARTSRSYGRSEAVGAASHGCSTALACQGDQHDHTCESSVPRGVLLYVVGMSEGFDVDLRSALSWQRARSRQEARTQGGMRAGRAAAAQAHPCSEQHTPTCREVCSSPPRLQGRHTGQLILASERESGYYCIASRCTVAKSSVDRICELRVTCLVPHLRHDMPLTCGPSCQERQPKCRPTRIQK